MKCMLIFLLVGGGFIQVEKNDIARVIKSPFNTGAIMIKRDGDRESLRESVDDVLKKIREGKCE